MFLFRLLHEKEFPEDGLIATDPDGKVSVDEHVTNGLLKRLSSQYITTMATYDAVYALSKQLHTDRIRLVQINVTDLLQYDDVKFVDLSTSEGRSRYLKTQKACNFGMKYDIILIKGKIPASCVSIYYEGKRRSLPAPTEDDNYDEITV